MPINNVTLVANLTRDVDLRTLPNGDPVASLRVAVNERRKVNGERTDAPNYFSVSVFGRSAESCAKFLSKGRQVAISGRLRWREYEKDGVKREVVEIVAQDVQFIGGREEGQGGGQQAPQQQVDDFGQTSTGWGQQPPRQTGPADDPADANIPFAFPVERDWRVSNYNPFDGHDRFAI